MKVQFDDGIGSLTWNLPTPAGDILADLAPAIREKILLSMGANLELLCAAMLRSFGDPITVEALSLIMREVEHILEKR